MTAAWGAAGIPVEIVPTHRRPPLIDEKLFEPGNWDALTLLSTWR
jgi:hypothetical protein